MHFMPSAPLPTCKQTVKKVPTGRHARTVGTHTGKLSAESVRGHKAECAVQRSILSPGTAKLRRVQRTKQPKRSRGSGLPFASPLRRAQQKQGTATTRGKEFLSRVCGQKWVPPGACRKSDTLKKPPRFTPQGFRLREAGIYLFSQAVSSQLSSAQVSLTSVFGMGTGGASPSSTPAVQALHFTATVSCIS